MKSVIHIFRHDDSIQRIKLPNIRNNEQFYFSKITKAVVKKMENKKASKKSTSFFFYVLDNTHLQRYQDKTN